MPLAFRPAREGDVDEVLALWVAAGAEPSHTDDPPGVLRLLGADPGALLLAERNGRIIGTVIAAWDGWRGSIYRLVVHPEERRRGVGRLLLHEAERRLAHVGARRMQAIVVETDPAATAFWRASGWEQQVRRLRFVRAD